MTNKERENDQLRAENERLKLAIQYAIGGLDMAYNAVSKNFTDEALLHIGHHQAQLNKALNQN